MSVPVRVSLSFISPSQIINTVPVTWMFHAHDIGTCSERTRQKDSRMKRGKEEDRRAEEKRKDEKRRRRRREIIVIIVRLQSLKDLSA